jgi:hypothetical protein
MRARGAAAFQGYDGLVLKVKALEAELASKDARIAELEATPTLAGPLPDNVVALPNATAGKQNAPAGPAPQPPKPVPSQPPTDEERARALAIANAAVPEHIRDTRPKGEAWRDHMSSAHYDRWANRNW